MSRQQNRGECAGDNDWHRNLRLAKAIAAGLGDLDEVARVEAMQRQLLQAQEAGRVR
jgi:hypothetical protein